MKKIILNNQKIAFIQKGNKNAPKLFLLHPFTANFRYYTRFIDFVERDFNILSLDFPGFGLSDSYKDRAHSLENYAKTAIELADFLNFKPFYVVGSSMGGMIGIIISSLFPDYTEKLIVQGSPYDLSCIRLGVAKKILDTLSLYKKSVNIAGKVKERTNNSLLKLLTRIFGEEEFREYENSQGGVSYSFKTLDITATAEIWHDIKNVNLAPLAKNINCPTLVISGSNDMTVYPQKVKELSGMIPDSKFVFVKGGPHALFLHSPGKLAVLAEDFLKEK